MKKESYYYKSWPRETYYLFFRFNSEGGDVWSDTEKDWVPCMYNTSKELSAAMRAYYQGKPGLRARDKAVSIYVPNKPTHERSNKLKALAEAWANKKGEKLK